MNLVTTPNFSNADDFYEALIETHRDLDVAASHALNARLVLLLANHFGATAATLLARRGAAPRRCDARDELALAEAGFMSCGCSAPRGRRSRPPTAKEN